jgi:hypothetical protein
MERLLIIWLENQIQKSEPCHIMTVEAKARSLFEDIKVNLSDPEAKFMASNGWFHIFEAHSNFHGVTFIGKAESADVKAAELHSQIFGKFIEDGGCTAQPISNLDEAGLF